MITRNLPILLSIVTILSVFSPTVQAGNCKIRDKVDWHATVSSATHVRVQCDDHKGPVGDSVGVVSGGTIVQILEVDKNREYFMVQGPSGIGFIYKSFLNDVKEFPMPGGDDPAPVVAEKEHEEPSHPNSVFSDLPTTHKYYPYISDVKSRGIVSGSNGAIKADDLINRVELAKILVEATTDEQTISKAMLADGVYSDIEPKGWYRPYLKVAKDRGIMTGDKRTGSGPTTLRPGDSANGGEVAKMIAVAFDLDVQAAKTGEQWYKPYLEALRDLGALPYTKGDHQVTRGEMMFMVSVVLSQ